MVIVKAEVQERKIANNLVWLCFQTEEPIFRRTEHFHKDLFFHTQKHLDFFANHIGQGAINLVQKIMAMKNVTSVTVFNRDEDEPKKYKHTYDYAIKHAIRPLVMGADAKVIQPREKIIEMKYGTSYDAQRLVVGIDTTDIIKKRTLPGIKSYIKTLLAAMPIEQEVVKIAP